MLWLDWLPRMDLFLQASCLYAAFNRCFGHELYLFGFIMSKKIPKAWLLIMRFLFFTLHPLKETLLLACMYNTCIVIGILGVFFLIWMSDEMTRVAVTSILPHRLMCDCVSKRKLEGCSYRKKGNCWRETMTTSKDRGWEMARDKINQTELLLFKKKAEKRKWSPALLYPNMPSILSQREEEHRDIIISPPWAVCLY